MGGLKGIVDSLYSFFCYSQDSSRDSGVVFSESKYFRNHRGDKGVEEGTKQYVLWHYEDDSYIMYKYVNC